MKDLHRSLSLTAMVCERGASLEQFKHIVFAEGSVRAFNGIVHLQAPSGLDEAEVFAVNYDRLAMALRALRDAEFTVAIKPDFLIFKRGKLTVRVRRLPAEAVYNHPLVAPPKAKRIPAGGLIAALSAVAPFVSSDASRPWSAAALLRGGYAWATNNLALVRQPFATPGEEIRIPGPVIPLLLELGAIDWYAKVGTTLVLGSGGSLLCFPTATPEWPDVESFFASRPKKIPKADPELVEAAKTVEKFSDRFVTLSDTSIEGKVATIESEYEVAAKNGKGSYNAQLFSLVAAHATHIDFSSYPKPVHFTAGEMQGLMIGVAPVQAGSAP